MSEPSSVALLTAEEARALLAWIHKGQEARAYLLLRQHGINVNEAVRQEEEAFEQEHPSMAEAMSKIARAAMADRCKNAETLDTSLYVTQLGTRTDSDISRDFGVAHSVVRRARMIREIPKFKKDESPKSLSKEKTEAIGAFAHLFGVVRDYEIAWRAHVSGVDVCSYRRNHEGLPKMQRRTKKC